MRRYCAIIGVSWTSAAIGLKTVTADASDFTDKNKLSDPNITQPFQIGHGFVTHLVKNVVEVYPVSLAHKDGMNTR